MNYSKIFDILQKNNLNYENVKNIYDSLQDLYLKETDIKTKDITRVLSSAIFEFKNFYIDYEGFKNDK